MGIGKYVVMKLELTAVIPTKNRPSDLIKAVDSILAQTKWPDELIIVDQSSGDESRDKVEALVLERGFDALDYIHDTAIAGLVDAKRVAVERARGKIVCFLEDDVTLDPQYFEKILAGFAKQSDMVGCCGVVTNIPNQNRLYEKSFHLFHRGIFKDIRVGIDRLIDVGQGELIPSDKLSGGLSAWRNEVFAAVKFDVANGFHMLEDIDFSTRVQKHYGQRLYINPRARLEHHVSPLNRAVLGAKQRRKVYEFILYYKKRRTWSGAVLDLPWLLCGLLLESVFQCYSNRSFSPLQGYVAGLRDGFERKLAG